MSNPASSPEPSPSPSSAGLPPPAQNGRRWLILFVGLIAMIAGCTFQYGLRNSYRKPGTESDAAAVSRHWPASSPGQCPRAYVLAPCYPRYHDVPGPWRSYFPQV